MFFVIYGLDCPCCKDKKSEHPAHHAVLCFNGQKSAMGLEQNDDE